MTLSRLGEFIRDSGVKPAELADLAGVTRWHLSHLRYGLAKPERRS